MLGQFNNINPIRHLQLPWPVKTSMFKVRQPTYFHYKSWTQAYEHNLETQSWTDFFRNAASARTNSCWLTSFTVTPPPGIWKPQSNSLLRVSVTLEHDMFINSLTLWPAYFKKIIGWLDPAHLTGVLAVSYRPRYTIGENILKFTNKTRNVRFTLPWI